MVFLFFFSDSRLLDIAATYKSSKGQSLDKSLDAKIRVRKASKRKFVSAFCQSNCGDVSPNTLGAFCIDTGLPCDFNHSTCNGKNELCYGRGPGYILLLHDFLCFSLCPILSFCIFGLAFLVLFFL